MKMAGIAGTMFNYSEHLMSIDEIWLEVKRAKKLGITTCICVSNVEAITTCTSLLPDCVKIS